MGVLKLHIGDDDTMDMSDLSNLLGDVYGHQSGPETPPARREQPAPEQEPEWASDSQLDRAFADWEPEARYPLTPTPPADDDLAAALSAALGAPAPAPAPPEPAPAYRPAPSVPQPSRPAAGPTPAAVPAPTPAPGPAPPPAPAPVVVAAPGVASRAWAPGDDDIFPNSGKAKGKAKSKKR